MPTPKQMTIAMMALKPKGKGAAMPNGADDEEAGADGAQEHLDACADLIDAIKGGDPQQVADALDVALETRSG